ncbi:unnamed protein product [Urochloa humidicola]
MRRRQPHPWANAMRRRRLHPPLASGNRAVRPGHRSQRGAELVGHRKPSEASSPRLAQHPPQANSSTSCHNEPRWGATATGAAVDEDPLRPPPWEAALGIRKGAALPAAVDAEPLRSPPWDDFGGVHLLPCGLRQNDGNPFPITSSLGI